MVIPNLTSQMPLLATTKLITNNYLLCHNPAQTNNVCMSDQAGIVTCLTPYTVYMTELHTVSPSGYLPDAFEQTSNQA